MTIVERLTLMFMKDMFKSPKGRSHFLTQVAEAENNDEGKVFAALKERAKSDPTLFKMVSRHAADEERHAELLGARADATGVPRAHIPESLKILHRLDEALGGFFQQPIRSDEDVMRAYLLLQVIEERAVTQFPIFREALRESDPESAEVFAQIEADEERHLKYCQAVARRYAPSEQVHLQTLEKFRQVEAKVFAQNSTRNMFHALEQGLLEVSAPVKLMWRIIGSISRLLDPARPTPYTNLGLRQLQPALSPS